ncbi:MAG: beta-ketoacyl-ACP synthase II [Chloroflexota bacterium]|nr:beta-ketoacyl-ACP synthase II [Chloroflexota bacterium]
MSGRRVVVTGMGAVTPLGNTVKATWDGFLAGRSGIGPITMWDASDLEVRFGGEVKSFTAAGAASPKELRQMDRGCQYALVAANESVADAGLEITDANRERVGIVVGTGAGGVVRILEQQGVLETRGPARVAPMFLPYFLPDTSSGVLAIALGAEGPNMAVASACATGTHAVGEGFETIRRDDADVILAGGTEASLLKVIVAGFVNMRALATRNEAPERASRPFDKDREGFVIGEGAGILLLEDLDHAKRRGARIYCELVGYGSGNDAFHMVAPSENGVGAARVMRAALRKAGAHAGLAPDEVDYINAHGTSTPYNDKFETLAIKDVFGGHARELVVSSTKSMIGHLFGAAGAVEAVACVKAIETGVIPPTINYETPDPDCDLDYAPNVARERRVRAAMSNSFGLGGHNSTVVFRRFAD